MTTEQKIVTLVIVLGLLVGFGVGYMIWGRPAPVIAERDTTITDTETMTEAANEVAKIKQDLARNQAAVIASIQGGSEEVEVKNQPAGISVTVEHAVLSFAGWIAVFEDINGDLGNVLGARGFAAGEYRNFFIPLLRGTIGGGKYHVGIFKENGDGKFDRKTDALVRAEDGEMIGGEFTTW